MKRGTGVSGKFCTFLAFLLFPAICLSAELLPPTIVRKDAGFQPRIDYDGFRFREAINTIAIVGGDSDGIFTGFKLPFLRKDIKMEVEMNLRVELPVNEEGDKYIVREVKTEKDSDTKLFKRIKKMSSLNDLKGLVKIRSAFEALEFLRLTTSPITEVDFPGMVEIYCISNFVETAPEVSGNPVNPMETCRENGFSPPEGPFDLEIARVEVKRKGSLSLAGLELLDRLVASLKRTTTEKKKVEIEFEKMDEAVKVRKEDAFTPEEDALIASLIDVICQGRLKFEIEIEAEVDEKKVPDFFVISRTVYSRADRAYVRVAEEVGKDGSWRILNRRVILPLTAENFKFFGRP